MIVMCIIVHVRDAPQHQIDDDDDDDDDDDE